MDPENGDHIPLLMEGKKASNEAIVGKPAVLAVYVK